MIRKTNLMYVFSKINDCSYRFHIESIIVFINFPLDFKQNFKALINNYNIFVNFL